GRRLPRDHQPHLQPARPPRPHRAARPFALGHAPSRHDGEPAGQGRLANSPVALAVSLTDMPTHRLIPDVLSVGDRLLDPVPRDLRPTRAEIALGALVANAAAVKARVGAAGVLAVIKADAYGHGAVPAARALEHAPIAGLAVSLAEEGIELRRAGI